MENQKDYQDLQDIYWLLWEKIDCCLYLIEIGLLYYLMLLFAELVERKNYYYCSFRKSLSKFFLTQDYFEHL